MTEEEITQKNILEYQKTVTDLCRKVAVNPKLYTAYVVQDELPCLIPVSGVLEVVTEDYTREIASLRALVKELADALNHELSTGCVCCLAAHQTSKCPHSVCDRKDNRALVAKAREVVSKTETTAEVCK